MADSVPDFDYRTIDEIIHGRVRLAIVAFLSGAGKASFGELGERAQVNDGNLSVHLRTLEEAGYVALERSFVGRKPRTVVSLTEAGRIAWLAYIARMQALIGP